MQNSYTVITETLIVIGRTVSYYFEMHVVGIMLVIYIYCM